MRKEFKTVRTNKYKRTEEALHKINRYFRVLSGCNQALIRASNEHELMQKICRIIVEKSNYLSAWVGFIKQNEEDKLYPVAHCGLDDFDLDILNIFFPDLHSGIPYIARHILTNPEFIFLQKLAKKYGFSSYASLPLIHDSKLLGVLNIYSPDPNAFDKEEITLLTELVNDLSFGITTLRARLKQKDTELALRETEKQYRILFEETKDTVFFTSPLGKFLDINKAGVELFGYETKEEMLRIDITHDMYLTPQDRDKYLQTMASAGFVKDYELGLKRKDGKKIIVLITASAVLDEKGKAEMYRGIMRDLTRRKALEAQLLQAQKMESVGRLAGGIAHDFNNLLTSIMGYTELMKMKLQPHDPLLQYVNQVMKAGTSAKNLVQQILAFSRKAMIQPKVLNLNLIIENFKNMLMRILGEDILLEFIPGAPLGSIKVDPHQVEQIIMNLTVNSRDAMPNGGRLVIETKEVKLDSFYTAKYPQVKPGNYIMLSVTDTGCGMDEHTIAQVFEPFFTTKEKSIGTGLGLSTVYGIVTQSNGHINVYSELGIGTTIKIYFPLIEEEAVAIVSSDSRPNFCKGTEAILIVEDEENVRNLTQKILEECGYKVFTASCPAEAFRIWEQNLDRIDLLLTDLVMPGESGQELALQIWNIYPTLPVVFMTGYSDYMISQYGIMGKDIHCIQKPFLAEELTRRIREVLDKS